ncbi:MAG: ATP-binding protein, partial [Bryobacterales bacterium]|nr:ATP-binding protein [Bryobacterales bacterium]
MAESGSHRIRPAGRHILTIGRDLVQDPHAAVIELVKNAYDADSPDALIAFDRKDNEEYRISVTDHGHGMTRDTVINKWMVPSTPDKQDRAGRSPGGRTMQGRKGIGRYAASVLGKDLLLETTTASGERTTLYLQWSDFERAKYLDSVEVLIETKSVEQEPGTTLTMAVGADSMATWGQSQFNTLRFELRKLMPPFPMAAKEYAFRVVLRSCGIPGVDDMDERVEPFPLVEYFDYRIVGKVGPGRTGTFVYSHQKSRNASDEVIQIDLGMPSGCGELEIDIRVYDRDPASVAQLIRRGLKHPSGNYMGKLEARSLLNEYNGIGVYRNGFRLRPLGDPQFDWLKLNQQRIQAPSRRIGNNQVIGYVQIQSEDQSNLIEKSARDGLIDNKAFRRLREITQQVISKLEEKRFVYRRRVGLGRETFKVESELERLYSFDTLKRDVRSTLGAAQVSDSTTSKVIALIESDERRRSATAKRLRDAIAVYQGHATVGKIINVVLHEGRRPLSYFRNHYPLLRKYAAKFGKTTDPLLVPKIVESAAGIADNADDFVALFRRLDPLAAQRRLKKKSEVLGEVIRRAKEIFSRQINEAEVTFHINGNKAFKPLPQNLWARSEFLLPAV